MNRIVRFWRGQKLLKPPYVHEEDRGFLNKFRTTSSPRNHQAFMRSDKFGAEKDTSLHTSLLPVPYQGNLNKADIFIVLLNPGLGLSDYYTHDNKQHSSLMRKIIRQDMKGIEYPFVSLDPTFAWSGGFNWWEKKLRSILRRIADEKCSGRYVDALKLLSQRMASIEIMPYHSKSFSAHRIIEKLPSSIEAKSFVEGDLATRARKGELTLIITRQASLFKLPACKDIVVYRGGHARGASLGLNTNGGKAILRRVLT